MAVPEETGVTTPVEASTVAIAVLDEEKVPPVVVETKVVVPFEHIACVPVKALTTGGEFTVNTTVDIAAEQPPAPSGSLLVKVNVTVPVFPAVGVKVTVFGVAV